MDSEKAFSLNQILNEVRERIDWKLAGITTALARMAEKGYVYCDRTTRTSYYSALIAEKYKVEGGYRGKIV